MKNFSIWKKGFPYNVCDKLNKNIAVDVLIIGGGMTGMNTAYNLKDSKLKVCVVERNNIGFGKTLRTTGKLTYLQDKNILKINKYHGLSKVKDYIYSQIKGINRIRDIIENESINCNLEENKGYVFSFDSDNSLSKLGKIFDDIGVKYKKEIKKNNGEKIYIISCDESYVFHPLKYLYGLKDICLKNNIDIYENTNIISIDKNKNEYECKTSDNYIVKAKYVVLALHYPYFLKPFYFPFKSYIIKSYIEGFKVSNNKMYNAISIDKPVVSTRFYSDGIMNYQLLLSFSHNLAFNKSDKENFRKLKEYGKSNPDYAWSNMDIMTIDSLPYIGRIKDNENIFIGTGYNAWGMVNSVIAGDEISNLILNGKSKYNNLFDPQRGINKGFVINFPLVMYSNLYSFIKSKITKNNNLRYELHNGKKVAIYTDENNIEHKVYTLCPHLKCSLKFNEIEKTWDCPCHSSRFDIDGNLLEGPSNYNIKYKE